MKLNIKLISALLAFVMLFGTVTSLFTVSVFAEETTTEAPNTTVTEEEEEVDYTKVLYATPEEKLATMTLMVTKAGYELYADPKTGEVATKKLSTGELLFTNPYDVATSKGSEDTKYEIMSQIIVNYVDNGSKKVFTSYEMAALRDQIKVKNIKNGIRVEYTIGREEARRLVPRLVEKSDFERTILDPLIEYYGLDPELKLDPPIGQIEWFYYKKLFDWYSYMDLDNCATEQLKNELKNKFPITEKMDVYVLDPNVTTVQLEELEGWIKSGCPAYSYEEMDAQHQKTEYQGEDENPPLFKMALEYTISDDGSLGVRLPANGLRFNESKYQLDNISILPYMGAGNNTYDGYTFYPDGSGALFTFDDLNTPVTTTISSKMYGVDYAYHKITGTYQENITYPVFGVVENSEFYDVIEYTDAGEEKKTTINGAIYETIKKLQSEGAEIPLMYQDYANSINNGTAIKNVKNRGYVGIIEEGDAMAEIATYHAGSKSNYNTIQMYFNPRPKDSYNLADAISVGTNDEWTVVSSRKYVGNYKIRYTMLSDENIAEESGLKASEYYKTSWLGMAFAYRDYLVKNGVLTKLSEEQTSGDIPVYIEAFGAMDAVEKIMSIPVTVTKPLTSFENIKTMYDELAEDGVSNINFKLTGFAKDGLYSAMPTKSDWDDVVEKDMDFQELLDYAAGLEDGELGIFPDFDFSFVKNNTLFDAVVLSKHAIKTIDDRYTTKRIYSATRQQYMGYGELAISPAYFNEFYESLVNDYTEYENISGISVGTLGSTLNSDFDEDEPYNREDSKGFITKALEYFSSKDNGNMEVMVDSGNSYTWEYVDHILGAALDSSRYIQASYSVPFIGVVLHGYMNFAGDPLNMEGDVNYAMLKAIENGASIYFTLSYDNTEILKEDILYSEYYSIRYDIWRDDVAELYEELNNATKDVQDKLIINHEFLSGTRIPDADELYYDITTEYNAVLEYEKNKAEYEAKKKLQVLADARELIANTEVASEQFVIDCLDYYKNSAGSAKVYNAEFRKNFVSYIEANCAYMQLKAVYDDADADTQAAMKTRVDAAKTANEKAFNTFKRSVRDVINPVYKLEQAYTNLTKLLKDVETGRLAIEGAEECPESIVLEIREQVANIERYVGLELGVSTDLSVEMLSVNTFIDTHLSLLFNDQHDADVKEYTENILRMMEDKAYGLNENDLGLLRYLDANKKLSDDELIEKYQIDKDGKELYGIVLYIRELLGNVKGQTDPTHTFDPILDDTGDWSEVDNEVLAYYISKLYDKASGMSDLTALPSLNFVPTKLEAGELVDNKNSNDTATRNAVSAIRGALTVEAGEKYDHTAKKVDTMIDKAVEKGIAAIEKASDVKYATPETLEDDVKALAIAIYYQEALKKNYKTSEASMPLVTKTYDVAGSIAILYKNRIESEILADFVDQQDTFRDVFEAVEESEEIEAALDEMGALLEDGYGDVREDLEKALYKEIANGLSKKKQKAFQYHFDDADAPKSNDIDNRIKEAVASITDLDAEFDTVVNTFVTELSAYNYKSGESLKADIEGKVYYYYYANLVDTAKKYTTAVYYYDSMLGKASVQLDALLGEHQTLAAEDFANAKTNYEKLDVLFCILASSDYSVASKTSEIAGTIEYYVEGGLDNNVLSIYFNRMRNANGISDIKKPSNKTVKGYLGDEFATVNKNIKAKVSELLKTVRRRGSEEGCLANYAFSSVMTADQLDAYINGIVDSLNNEPEDVDALKEALKDFILGTYYNDAKAALGLKSDTTFKVDEYYGNAISSESLRVKEMLYYFATGYSPLTDADIENLISKDYSEDDDGDGYSKYATSKGKLVAVTYGTPEADGTYKAYKTFLLNYNNFYATVT